ncbi:MFS transporter [Amphritea sp. 2_MG-2023]|jgi:MFS family permease|uniref:MFS transporter n=1 Tax=Amphritea TaxID=515417 RepID=UPI001C06ABD9|nr:MULTISPECIES: MFS transporter [Amphritea]MBU2966009.1 MFS transporter [Amphritea atlantica]MDO6418099.1 MFS transporter [Amphritea sp. 2_MG-2023]MDX2421774.1 MFS transporter [Amphritea sp.]
MQTNILLRIQPILFSIFAVAVSHNLFFVMLPIRLKEGGFASSDIGMAMSMFAVGAIMAGIFGSRAVLRAGHIRAFSSMAAMLAIVSVCHSYFLNIWITGGLRMVAGFCFVTSFITLESWLNVLSDKRNRGTVFSTYQICFAIGFGSAPFLFSLSSEHDPRLFGLIGVFLCISLIIMSMSRLPLPELPSRPRAMSPKRLWGYSPSGTLSCFCAGLISAASVSLISLYAYDHGITGIWLSLVLGSYQLGGLLTQYPVGWLADRYDKRSVAAGLMVLGVVSNLLIVAENFVAMPIEMLVVLFLVSGGSGVALFPLAVTQVFDHIDTKEAISATSTMQILLGCGGVLGPIIAGFLMTQFDSVWLYYYLVAVHLLVGIFLIVRKLYVRTETLESHSKYQISMQTSVGTSVLDPQLNYNLAEIGDPELKLLLVALGQYPKDPGILISTALEGSSLKPQDVAIHMVLALPKGSGELIKRLVQLFPDDRLAIAYSLRDLFVLRKERINAMLLEALVDGADDLERTEIDSMMEHIIREQDEEDELVAASAT